MVIKHLAVPFLYTPFQDKYGTATEINLLIKGNKRGKMRQIISKKSYIVYTLLILSDLAIIPTTNTSALGYQTDVGVSFTFSPTLSVSISSDLVISNLTPGTTDTSNEISVNASTNNAYGYNLYTTVGNSTYDDTSLTSSSSNDIFTSILTTANLPTLTTDNTWGYTYSLDNGTTWSNYNGLPLYTTDSPTRLKKNTGPSNDTINFKIAAKAGSTQPSGTYTNIINFTAITKPTPITLADAYAKEGKELYKGYYKMQDMTSTICEETEDIGAQLQVIDIRDDKVYWIAKLADSHCWMTQNLDLDIDDTRTYTHYDTDLGWTTGDETATWKPTEGHSTINFTGTTVDGWVDSNTEPYSADPGDIYYYTSNSNADDIRYDSTQECTNTGYNDCIHYHVGNYYNWSAAAASNNTAIISEGSVSRSICPSGWQLPDNNSFRNLFIDQDIINLNNTYLKNGFNNIRSSPIYLVRSGRILSSNPPSVNSPSLYGNYWSSAYLGNNFSRCIDFRSYAIYPLDYAYKKSGFSLRCFAR